MAFLRDLESRFEQRMDELYSRSRFPEKDSGELHPLLFIRPDDPNRQQGIGSTNRLVPIQRVLTDQRRFARFLTSTQGLQFLLKEQLLQTGNSISETRLLNPLFINLNLTPFEHFKRSLFDQTDTSLGSQERSPASTAEVGVAGRLQRETADNAVLAITNRPSARSAILSLLGRIPIVQTIAGTIGISGKFGTLGVNERPELDVAGRYYAVLLREGFQPFFSRELELVTTALNAAGTAASIIGLPNIFRGINNFSRGANPIPSQTEQMRYFITSGDDAVRYLTDAAGLVRRPLLLTPTSLRINANPRGTSILNAPSDAALRGLSLSEDVRRAAPLPASSLVSDLSEPRNDELSTVERLSFPDSALERRYEQDDRLAFIRNALAEQATLMRRFTDALDTEAVPPRGIAGGITLEQLRSLNANRDAILNDEQQVQEYFQTLPKREIGINDTRTAPGYYHDTLNLITRVSGSVLPAEIEGQPVPQDYINVAVFDKVNGRLEPFRAILAGISETITPEFSDTRFIGRIERNIVYLGATRELSFMLTVHAWSPRELQRIWDKVAFITGLAFPSAISADGFLLPPIVELTLGNFYTNQPGYFTSINHTIEDGTSWEIEPGAQVPKTVNMNLTFAVIEKESMTASAPFYGFGVPLTQ